MYSNFINYCPNCGAKLIDFNCSFCGWKLEGGIISIYPSIEFIIDESNPCKNCPNDPSNGGSGICHCVLGCPKITC